MKKLLTMTLTLIVLAAFTGLGVAQEKKTGGKPVESAAIPPADKLTLSGNPNVLSKTGCPVTARLFWSVNPALKYPGRTVDVITPPIGAKLIPPPPYVTNSKSEAGFTVPWGKNVTAVEQSFGLQSQNFKCKEMMEK